MTPSRYRFQVDGTEIEAVRVTADNPKDVCDWISSHALREGSTVVVAYDHTGAVTIDDDTATGGDYVARDADGCFNVWPASLFERRHELIEQGSIDDLPLGQVCESEIDTTNEFMVSARWGPDGTTINMLRPPRGPMAKDQALTLAAYLVLLADPTGERFDEIREAVAST